MPPLFFRLGVRNGFLCCSRDCWRGVDFFPLIIMRQLILLILFLISGACFSAGGGVGAAQCIESNVSSCTIKVFDSYEAHQSYISKQSFVASYPGDCGPYTELYTGQICLGVFITSYMGVNYGTISIIECGSNKTYNPVTKQCQRDCSALSGELIQPYLYQTYAWSICDDNTLSCQSGSQWPSGITDYRCEDGCKVLVDLSDAGKNLYGGCSQNGSGASKDNPLPIYCYVKQAGYTGAECTPSTNPTKPTSGTTQSGESWSSSTTSTGSGGTSGGSTAPGDSTSTSGGSPTNGDTSGTGSGPGTGSDPGTGDGSGSGTGTGSGDVAGIYGQNRCADSFLCTGDAVQCGVAREAWIARCIAEQVNTLEGNDNSVFDPNKPFGSDDFKQKGEDALNKNGLFDFDVMEAFQKNRQEYFSFAGSCISTVPVNINGNLLNVDLSILCEYGKFIRLIMHIAAYLIVLRLMHRTLV